MNNHYICPFKTQKYANGLRFYSKERHNLTYPPYHNVISLLCVVHNASL